VSLGGRTRNTRGLVILLVTISLVTITIDYRQGSSGPLAKLGQGALSVITPLQEGVTKLTRPIGHFFAALAHLPSLERENRDLRQQLAQARTLEAEAQAVIVKLHDLEDALKVARTLTFNTTGATVVGSSVSNFEWSVDIDKGSSDGIKVGMPVLAAQGLVGHVVEVSPFGSKVQLIADPDSKVADRLVTSNETGLLQGQGQGNMVMTLLPESTQVNVDDPVETAGYQGGLYPAVIPIGKVDRVRDDPTTGEKTVFVRPYVDFSALDIVLVVLSSGNR